MNDPFKKPQNVVVLGGNSDIAFAILKELAKHRLEKVVLAGPNQTTLHERASMVSGLGKIEVLVASFDATDLTQVAAQTDLSMSLVPNVDLLIMAAGILGDQSSDESEPMAVSRVLTTNFTGPAVALTAVVEKMKKQGTGSIIVLSSVAGAKVRRSNFIYGSSKAGLDAFALGFSDALWDTPIQITVVRPGFVKTKMTESLKTVPMSTTPEKVAIAALRAMELGKDIVWVPQSFRTIIFGLRHMPRSVNRKLPF
ncbi:MAG: SDR family NAD(P)-dependent oxidoreductase [Acidimicrobiaceae bacterium]|nr:SDR family NAD(P)-dependent oxidoreductase [Acidimicrobiaceae bacterium]